MTFLPIAILAYLFNGISMIIDKVLLRSSVKDPLVFTFYATVSGAVVLVLIPFGLNLTNPATVILSILSGVIFALGLLTLFLALKYSDLIVATPLVGALNPVSSLIIGSVFLSITISTNQLISFILLLGGGILLTLKLWWQKSVFSKQFLIILSSGIFFGLSYVLLRMAFETSTYLNVLIISRLGMALFGLVFLIFPSTRRQIFSGKITKHHFINKISFWVLASQLAGGLSGLLITFAVSLESPAIVNSIYGIQYILLFGVVLLMAKISPHLLDENLKSQTILEKILGLILVAGGLYYLAV